MKTTLTAIVLLFHLTAGAEEGYQQVHFSNENGEAAEWTWLPITLNDSDRELLEQRSEPPEKALDYYLLLPEAYFRNIENSLERRVTFIDQDSLSDQYLHAAFTVPSVDAGAFFVTIRVFQKDGEPLIAIRHRGDNHRLHKAEEEKAGELIWINLGRPQFWRYRKREWIPEDGSILPGITKEYVLDRYRNHYKAHLNYPTQKKIIVLGYQLPPTGGVVQVTGRENFMSPQKKYVWAEFTFDGDRFVATTNSEQGGGGQPATRLESK